MLKRAWVLLNVCWVAMWLLAGTTREGGGPLGIDFAIAFGPWVIGWLLRLASRFVLTGQWTVPVCWRFGSHPVEPPPQIPPVGLSGSPRSPRGLYLVKRLEARQ